MIPRLRPYFNLAELIALLKNNADPVTLFEKRFAEKLGVRFAIAFPYMRSAITTVLKAHDIKDSEIIVPAFTCVVVPNAVVVSLNTPRFVDINLTDYNMDLEELESKITLNTKAVVATHMFGAPLDLDRLKVILKDRSDILVIQDCALALFSTYKGKPIWEYDGITMFSFSIGKHISALEGGAVVTNDESVYRKLKQFRDENFDNAGLGKSLSQILFLIEILGGLNKLVYGFVLYLAEQTSLLNSLSVYYDEEKIYLPEDYQTFFTNIQAKIGLAQLDNFSFIMKRRKEINEIYHRELKDISGIVLPPVLEDGIYSHFNIRVKNRADFITAMKKHGVNVGKELFDYCIPDFKCYKGFSDGDFSNTRQASQEIVNIPNYPHLTNRDLERIVDAVKKTIRFSI